ncbi:sensor histidine kinase KdpD [uncultured Dubosiella sp.]|uniref:sensor histidine kinase n=1 Tax=uncultured Dubosiella sp. TaxID=1937011 RepID=UPI0025B44389|nr:sensor histidine kinase [uncultured Dubosiella sp.]
MILSLFVLIAFNLYTILLLRQVRFFDLVYFDALFLFLWAIGLVSIQIKKHIRNKKIDRARMDPCRIAGQFAPYIDQRIYAHDIRVLETRLRQEHERNSELKDHIDRIVHELKASLNTISLCDETTFHEPVRLATETMNRQLSQLLLLAKLETNIVDVQIQKADLRSLLHTSVKNNKYFLIHERFSIRIDCPAMTVYTDPEWLVYVFDQLLINAIKYRREPKIEITAFQDDQCTTIQVTDYGIGIPASDLDAVFEKGVIGRNVRSGSYRSTGMGLYFARAVLARLGGTIEAKSKCGAWTTFTIRLFHNENMDWLREAL